MFVIDMTSYTVRVMKLGIAHKGGILLGGNGIVSPGEVVISSGVKFAGRSPSAPTYFRDHANQAVFRLGNNVFIGANTVVIGPISICADVIISASSLVNRDIKQHDAYSGTSIGKFKSSFDYSWFLG
jgi:serine O-acetyltransferase